MKPMKIGLPRIIKQDPYPMTTLIFGQDWYELIQAANLCLLSKSTSMPGVKLPEDDFSWKIAPSLLGAEMANKISGCKENARTIQIFFHGVITTKGEWKTPVAWGEHAMKGYTALSLAEQTLDKRYRMAADRLANLLVYELPRAVDGSLPYRPGMDEVLVDTLAMICPFLARYGRLYQHLPAIELAVNQLLQFIQQNVDPLTCLPYHGYYPNGPKRLGLHAWGRGTGWYMLGLIDTILELPPDHPQYQTLRQAFLSTAESVCKFQRQDGHWNWAILHKVDTPDSSTTATIGYCLARGIQAGFLDWSYYSAAESACRGLVSFTRSNGILEGALGECMGLGKYPQQYGPQPWLQGMATAFAALQLSQYSHL